MGKICYNKSTKRKNGTKNVCIFHKNGENTDELIEAAEVFGKPS